MPFSLTQAPEQENLTYEIDVIHTYNHSHPYVHTRTLNHAWTTSLVILLTTTQRAMYKLLHTPTSTTHVKLEAVAPHLFTPP